MYSRVDRGGSREGKKSLRKNKIAIQTLAKGKPEPKAEEGPTASPPAPPIPRSGHAAALIDFGCHLINRQFDRDQTKVLQRSRDAGIEAILSLCTDFEKQKTCLQNAAMSEEPAVLCAIGLHPNNVSSHRISEKQILTWMDEIAVLAKNPRSVAIDCGLDFSRDYSTWHAQEKALCLQIDLATTLQLPLIFHDIKATERLCEIIAEKRLEGHLGLGFAVFDFTGSLDALEHYLDLDAHIILCAQLADPAETAAHARAIAARVPADRLLLASNAPFCTPQNIEDYYIRDARNEPSNLPYTLNAASAARGVTPAELSQTLVANAKRLLRLRYPDEAPLACECAEPAPSAPGAGAAAAGEAEGEAEDAAGETAKKDDSEGDSSSSEHAPPPAKAAAPAADPDATSKKGAAREMDGAEARRVEGDAGGKSAKSAVEFACKLCRQNLFDLGHVQPHIDAGLRPRRDGGDGMCGALFVTQLPWMKLEGSEGKLVCPQCAAKIGRWSLAGIQCSCGGFCSPGFKITKSHVDAIVSFASPEQAEAALASLHLDSSSEEDEQEAGAQRQRKSKKKVKRQQIGNFTQFRNKSFNFARHAKKGGPGDASDDD